MGNAATPPPSNSPSFASAMVNRDDSTVRTCGADSARPPEYSQSKNVTDPTNRPRLKLLLVKRSAGFSSPNHFRRYTFPVLTACWVQKVGVPKCRNLRSPCMLQIPIAAIESIQRRKGTSTPRCLNRAWWPSPWPAPRRTPMNSASPELSAMLVWWPTSA